MLDDLTLANEQKLLQRLLERVAVRTSSEQEIESQYAADVRAEQTQYEAVHQLLAENYDAERVSLEQWKEQQVTESNQRCQTDSAAVQADFQRVLNEIEDRFDNDVASVTKERDEAIWLVSSLLDDDTEGSPLQRLQQTQTAYGNAEVELNAGLQGLEANYDQTVRFLQRGHVWSEPTTPDASVPASTVDVMKSACLASIAAAEPLRRRVTSRWLPVLFFNVIPLILFLGITGGIFGLIWGLVHPAWLNLKLQAGDRDWLYMSAGIAAAFSLLVVFFLHLKAGWQTWSDYEKLLQHRVDARYAFSIWERQSKTELAMLEAECSHQQSMRVKRRESAIGGAESKFQARIEEIQSGNLVATQQARSIYPPHLNALETRRQQEHELIEQQYQTSAQDLMFRRETDFRKLQAEFDLRVADRRRRYQQDWNELVQMWQGELSRLGKASDQLCNAAAAICPPWNVVSNPATPFPHESPKILSLGRIEADLDMIEAGVSEDVRLKAARHHFDVPVLVPMHEQPSLILKATGTGRDAAVLTLHSTMLRYLTSLPPGKVRFTILDPVGLGANFSAFMHLADVDELLVTSRIWTEPGQIEKRLADLTEHMETVLQTYLRNEFSTIDDYNEYAGEVAEPYRVLVTANFPANFTDVAMRRLLSIADGGSRCGVYILMSFDQSLELPRGFAAADLEKHATVLQWTEYGFRLIDPQLGVWPLALDQPPAPEEFGQIVRLAGGRARDMRRVEVPFERVAPQPGQFWSSDSRTGIDVPIGRAGATKLQYLRLGKGTSQHVLVAGKTGSGKSTFLHALITNLALYYSPTEVEFYLIDFKKGVEFKVYAERRLPHARVIAIESDREFGVSVLERLDSLLRDRGELFRATGVQDIAGYRNARPDAVMPRTLLLVDEFQEFFIEDDAISQQAALLLDRLIRQGRAFGVHVLLGSQTLAGAYSLARSTLGQVAVRIALQCSETDAHLILSEENTAARLLTRPGEAIYNDANGLVEGNHPFQIVWLSEEARAEHLKEIRHQVEDGNRQKVHEVSVTPPVVFEGNIPADPTTNRPLLRLISQGLHQASDQAHSHSLDAPWNCWLGDSVSLAGPLELNFGLREGGNVLIVGRDEVAALGVMATAALAICAQAQALEPRHTAIQMLDGSLPKSNSGTLWRQLEGLWNSSINQNAEPSGQQPALIRTRPPKAAIEVLTEVIDELKRRGDEPGPPMFLFVYDLARFRDLRKADDDYGYGGFGGGDKPVNAAQLLSEILRDGPSVGIFVVTWVDSYATAQRWLSRDQLNRFELRILFAMNANDSASLIDSPAAGRLGENRGLLYRSETGTIEKFRPFSPPSISWLQELSSERPVAVPATTLAIPAESIAVEPQRLSSVEERRETEIVEETIEPQLADEQSDELPSIDELNVQ